MIKEVEGVAPISREGVGSRSGDSFATVHECSNYIIIRESCSGISHITSRSDSVNPVYQCHSGSSICIGILIGEGKISVVGKCTQPPAYFARTPLTGGKTRIDYRHSGFIKADPCNHVSTRRSRRCIDNRSLDRTSINSSHGCDLTSGISCLIAELERERAIARERVVDVRIVGHDNAFATSRKRGNYISVRIRVWIVGK